MHISSFFYRKWVNRPIRGKHQVQFEKDMQNDFIGFREGRSQCYAVELFRVPHLYLQRFLRTGQDKPLKNKQLQ